MHCAKVLRALVATVYTFVSSVSGEPYTQSSLKFESERHNGLPLPVQHAITPKFSAFVENLMKTANVPGITLGIVHTSGEESPLVELNAWGRKSEEGDGHDLATDALFDLASCSKAFLASAMGLLMDDFAQGRNVTPLPEGISQFDWNTKVRDMLPDDWMLEDEWASEKANIRDILAHVSGMPRHDFSYGPRDSPRSVVRNLRNLRPAYELRERWSYNNQMYKTGAYLISQYSNMSYTSFVSSRLFEALNMTSTTFWPDEAKADGKLTQTWTKFGRRIPFWFSDNDIVELMAGAGGVISSAEDMTKWVTMLLNSGVDLALNKTILPRSVLDEMTTAHAIINGAATDPTVSITGYGMGWMRWSYKGHEIVSHTGGIPGFSTQVALLPRDGLGIVVLANADEKAAANLAIIYRIVEDVLSLRHDKIDDSVNAINAAQVTPVGTSSPEVTRRKCSGARKHATEVGLELYAGTYSNPGYGAFTLCAPSSDSHYCNEVLRDFDPFGSMSGLYAKFPRIWSTHIRMTYHEGETFNVDFPALFPQGFGANKTAFETLETGEGEGQAIFVVEEQDGNRTVKGFGLIIDAQAVKARQRWVGTVEEYADAWFEKL